MEVAGGVGPALHAVSIIAAANVVETRPALFIAKSIRPFVAACKTARPDDSSRRLGRDSGAQSVLRKLQFDPRQAGARIPADLIFK